MGKENGKIFAGGIPTGVDVDKLIKELGVPKEGEVVSYDDISACLALPRDSYRWRTVVYAWLKRLEDVHGIIMEAIPNQGYAHTTPRQAASLTRRKFKSSIRGMLRASKKAGLIDRTRLDAAERRSVDFIRMHGPSMAMHARIEERRFKFLATDRTEA